MSDIPRLDSVRTGHARLLGTPGSSDRLRGEWHSAYMKEPRAGLVPVGPLGLDGDEQADRESHGGPRMAVLAYAAAHYPRWREELDLPAIGPGGFGENLVIDGLDETGVCIGDIVAVGSCRLQVSQPRGPCYNISRRWERDDLLQRTIDTGRTGWYLSVFTAGELRAGDRVHHIDRPQPDWSVERVFRLRMDPRRDPAAVRALATLPELSPEWREKFVRLAAGLRDA